jgi:zinc protease
MLLHCIINRNKNIMDLIFAPLMPPKLMPVYRKTLEKGIEYLEIPHPGSDVCKLDILFKTGLSHHPNKLIPSATVALLDDGTNKNSAQEIAETLDRHGAFLMASADEDYSRITLFSMKKFLLPMISFLFEWIDQACFPEEEVSRYRSKMEQQFAIQMQRVNNQSKKSLINSIFGENSPYGDPTNLDSFKEIRSEVLSLFLEDQFKGSLTALILSGDFPERSEEYLLSGVKNIKLREDREQRVFVPKPITQRHIQIKGNSNAQVSLRIGGLAIGPDHSDFFGMRFLLTLFGGYFGSRLNKVLREELGYTYGVHAAYIHHKHASYFDIHAELDPANANDAERRIMSMMDQLSSSIPDAEEVNRVIRYIKGTQLQVLDGVFAQSNAWIKTLMIGIDPHRFQAYFNYLDALDASLLPEIARRHLISDHVICIQAGTP